MFLGTDGAASSRVGKLLLFRVEGSIPYSAPLKLTSPLKTVLYSVMSRTSREDKSDVCRGDTVQDDRGVCRVNSVQSDTYDELKEVRRQ